MRPHFNRWSFLLASTAAIVVGHTAPRHALAGEPPRILVFTRTAGFRHDSIPDGVTMIQRLGAGIGGARCFEVVHTEDPAQFTTANLDRFRAVAFLCTTGDVLGPTEQAAFESFICSGGGFVGIHSATDTEYDWAFYGELIAGAHFAGHPAIQPATIRLEDGTHPSTTHLGASWVRTDEWYNFQQNPRPLARILLRLDESTYTGGSMGLDHPIAWCRDAGLGAGRAWYTAGGHTVASYTEPLFERHVLGGILWAARLGLSTNCPGTCAADFNGIGGVSIQDLFDFLAAYFANDARTDINDSGAITVQDIFDFLAAYFAGCP